MDSKLDFLRGLTDPLPLDMTGWPLGLSFYQIFTILPEKTLTNFPVNFSG
jgi:hypothetical protein